MSVERLDIVVTETGSRTVKRNIGDIAQGATAAINPLHAMREAVLGVAAAFGAREFLNTLREFELQQGMLRAVTAGSTEQMRALRNEALQMGSTTEYSATQAAHAQVLMARAGFSVNEVFESTPHVLRLAQATAMDIADAANIAAQSMRGMRLTTQDLNHVLDVLTYTANHSNTDVQMLGDGFKYAAPLAAGLHVPIEQVAAAAAALSDAGLQSTMFGTGLRKMLAELESPSRNTQRILQHLGYTMQQIELLRPSAWTRNGRELATVLTDLADHGMDAGIAMQVFGQRGGPAAGQMLAVAERIGQFTRSLHGANGVAETMAEVVMDNLQGSIWRFFGSIGTLIVRIGDSGLTGILRTLLTVGQHVFIAIADNMAAIMPLVIGIGTAFATHFAIGMVSSLLAARLGTDLLMTKLKELWVVIMRNPISALVGIIAAVVVALYNFRDAIHLSADGVVSLGDYGSVVFDHLKNLAQEAWQGIVDITGQAGAAIAGEMSNQRVTQNQFWEGVARTAYDWTNKVIGAFMAVWRTGRIVFTQLGQAWDDFIHGRGNRSRDQQISQAIAQSMNQDYLGQLTAEARRHAEERHRTEGLGARTPPINYRDIPDSPLMDLSNSTTQTRAEMIAQENRELEQNTNLLTLNTRERAVQSEINRINNSLEDAHYPKLTATEEQYYRLHFAQLNRDTELSQARDQILENTFQKQRQLTDQLRILQQMVQQGGPATTQFAQQLREVQLQLLQMQVESGRGSFADGFLLQLGRMMTGIEQFRAKAGQAFGDFFKSFTDGFADSVGRAIVYSEDLGASLQDVARKALSELISALVKMGIQWLLNATLGQTVAAASTAASAAMGAATAAAWAPAAAAVSLASYGANAVPAMAGITATYGLTQALGMLHLRDGGYISGPGGPRSDRVPVMASNGEFMVNAAATARNRATLEAMNRGDAVGGSLVVPITVNMQGGGSTDPARDGAQVARQIERVVVPLLQKHMRPGGVLARKPGA
jgi:TP901 family phage tail tape measure protein